MLFFQAEDFEDFSVTELDIVGRKDFERSVPGCDQSGEIGIKIRSRNIRDRDMKRVIDHGRPHRAGRVVGDLYRPKSGPRFAQQKR